MKAEYVHREKLKQLGYKDEAIEEIVEKYIASCTYEFAESYHADQIKNNGALGGVSGCDFFSIDPRTSSATLCICGKQKWEHH